MKKYLLIGVAVFGVFLGSQLISTQRELSLENQNVEFAVGQVQNVLNRQAELIPNLAETAKGYAKHENDTFTKIAAFRSKATEVANTNPSEVATSEDKQKQLYATATAGQQAFMALNQIREAYPELKANENFQSLMKELEGSINRVTVERRKSMEAIKKFNSLLVQFPKNLLAGLVGYHQLPFYQARETDQHAPLLNFSN